MTRDYKTHYLSLKQFDNYIHSDSETMETIIYLNGNDATDFKKIKSEVHPRDIISIGYFPKPTQEYVERVIQFDAEIKIKNT